MGRRLNDNKNTKIKTFRGDITVSEREFAVEFGEGIHIPIPRLGSAHASPQKISEYVGV